MASRTSDMSCLILRASNCFFTRANIRRSGLTAEVSHSRRRPTQDCNRDQQIPTTAQLNGAAAVGCTGFVRQSFQGLSFLALPLSSILNRRLRSESRFGATPPTEATASNPQKTQAAIVGLSSVAKWSRLPAMAASPGCVNLQYRREKRSEEHT